MRRFLLPPSGALLSALVFGCADERTTPGTPLEPDGIATARASAGGRPIDATFTFDVPEGVFCDFAIRFEGDEKEKP